MKHSLLDKARAILAQPKQGPPPNASRVEAGEKSSMTAPAIQNIEIQPAAPNAKAIYWETGTGRILGPAVPEFLARDGSTFWISTTFEGQSRWINADRLRSRKAFEEQAEVREVELIRS